LRAPAKNANGSFSRNYAPFASANADIAAFLLLRLEYRQRIRKRPTFRALLLRAANTILVACSYSAFEEPPMTALLTREFASRFANLALAHLTREYPNKLTHSLAGPQDVQSPRALHPI
jgi:hypothetical protein